jgi:putative addiction module CopG family antidote
VRVVTAHEVHIVLDEFGRGNRDAFWQMESGTNQVMNIPLPEHWHRFVSEEVQSGRFPSEAAVLEEALVLLRQREHGQARQNAVNGTHPRPIGEVIDELMGDVPRRSWTGSRLMEPPGTTTTHAPSS